MSNISSSFSVILTISKSRSRLASCFDVAKANIFAKMSVFPMAHNLTNRHSTEKDYIQPFTVMAEEHPPSPWRGGDTQTFRRSRIKSAMTVQGAAFCRLYVILNLKS